MIINDGLISTSKHAGDGASCVFMDSTDGSWKHSSCSEERAAVCRWSPWSSSPSSSCWSSHSCWSVIMLITQNQIKDHADNWSRCPKKMILALKHYLSWNFVHECHSSEFYIWTTIVNEVNHLQNWPRSIRGSSGQLWLSHRAGCRLILNIQKASLQRIKILLLDHSNHHHVFNNFCLPLPIPLKPGISVIIRKINQSQPSLISLLIFCHPPIKIIKILITFINWWSNQAAYRGSCYELVLSPTSASAAEADCVKKGGHLLSITSE